MRISDWSSDVCSSDLPFAIQPSRGGPWAHPAKLVEITHPAIEPEPAPEALARFDPPVAPHDHRQIGRSLDQSRQPFGLRRDEGRATLHRDPAQDRPQDRKRKRLNSSNKCASRMTSYA